MTSKKRQEADKLIKQGLEELAAEVQVPDVNKAYERYRNFRAREARYHAMVVVLASFLVIMVASTGPARAFRGFLRTTIAWMISETTELFQRADNTDNEVVIDVVDMQIRQYDSLDNLIEDEIVSGYVPKMLKYDWFTHAEVTIEAGQPRRLVINFMYEDTPLQLSYYSFDFQSSSGRIIDIEDFSSKRVTFNNHELVLLSDDRGFNIIQWDMDTFIVELWGYLPVEELLEAGITLGLL